MTASESARATAALAMTTYTAYESPAASASAMPIRKREADPVMVDGVAMSSAVPITPRASAAPVRRVRRSPSRAAASKAIISGAEQMAMRAVTAMPVMATAEKYAAW